MQESQMKENMHQVGGERNILVRNIFSEKCADCRKTRRVEPALARPLDSFHCRFSTHFVCRVQFFLLQIQETRTLPMVSIKSDTTEEKFANVRKIGIVLGGDLFNRETWKQNSFLILLSPSLRLTSAAGVRFIIFQMDS